MSDGKTEAYRSMRVDGHSKYYSDTDRNKPLTSNKNMEKTKDLTYMPNQRWHQIISFIKSGVRILGYAFLPFDLVIATGILIFSEVIGIVEELV
tara:strand:- start:5 stop:286 length:282 start_codon:yes stop_codon:yes gene_type:complete